ncbi:DUF421 domain-containing protein [Bacillus rubiinfantis]|uniref:DUF421 domain-containing protein n=1 Tax=Bacillus rubiinfantis TaxID=1499680 RepID=UPI0005A955B8|nr:DUF421 domain-containing protein [Bacillus rubiinfantis]
MEVYFNIILRTLILYAVLLLIFRFMGKREIGELSILDLVVFIMIGEMAVIAIENTNEPLFQTIIPMVLLMIIQITLALISLKSKRFRDLIDGKPTIIINRGKVDEQAMRKHRYNFDDLLMQLRENNVRSIADVEFAILETSGKLSVIEKIEDPKKPKTPAQNGDITIPLIMDGNIMEESLSKINKTNLWLRQELKKKGIKDLKKVSFCSYENGKFYIDTRDNE